jgi:hypothetical protein
VTQNVTDYELFKGRVSGSVEMYKMLQKICGYVFLFQEQATIINIEMGETQNTGMRHL